jgi:hypothetical protein
MRRALLICLIVLSVVGGCAADDGAGDRSIPVPIGEAVEIGGVSVQVERTEVADSVNYGLRRGRFLVVIVTLRSEREAPLEYGPLDWRVYTEDGATVEPIVVGEDDRLGFGTLKRGDTATGRLAFELGGYAPRGILEFRSVDGAVEVAWQLSDPEMVPSTEAPPVSSGP